MKKRTISIDRILLLLLLPLLTGACQHEALQLTDWEQQMQPVIETPIAETATSVCLGCAEIGKAAEAQQQRQAGRSEIDHWLYMLDVELNDQLVETIADSSYDLVVVDFVPSESGNEDYPMETVVERWHQTRQSRKVLAYVNIGQAEDYRSYWQSGWKIGNPNWILGNDSEGWEGNYPVAYWNDEWKDIWLGEAGLLQQVYRAGFDGIYMDNLEIYLDDSVIEQASRDGVDAAFEMFNWVYEICGEMRSLDPSFILVAQNSLDLLVYDKYVWCLDGVAQEHVWFDGGMDSDPEGDCPLPATSADIDSQVYRDSLSSSCLKYYENEPEGTLHTSSQEYIDGLVMAREQGLFVLTADYALDTNHREEVIFKSRSLGFVPFVGSRLLDGYIPPDN